MPSRFEFERAIKRSGLPPLARLIALVVASWADAETGRIAHKNQPAQSVLLEATGMSKSAFLTHRKTLLAEGWIECVSPEPKKARMEHAQNVYSIHIPDGKAGSPGDLAKTGKSERPGKARSGGDLAKPGMSDTARSGDDPAQAGEVGHDPVRLGRQATTRVFPSSSLSYLPADDSESAGDKEKTDAFTICQPLIHAMTDAGLTVSWQMQTDDWQAIARVLERAGVDAMVKHALGVKSREPIRFARYYLRAGWLGLPPKSTKTRPAPAAKPPWCKDPDCDEQTRFRDHETTTGHRVSVPCPNCHPNRKAPAA